MKARRLGAGYIMKKLKPLFRWAGAKTKMRKKYGETFWPNEKFTKFVDPFFGTGSVSMLIKERFPDVKIFANDQNADIINIYVSIRDHKEAFLKVLNEYEHEYLKRAKDQRKVFYYQQRDHHGWNYDSIDKIERAGLLFGLLKTSFNGIWQINANTNNHFGTACGLLNEKVEIYDRDMIDSFEVFAQGIEFSSDDFEGICDVVDEDTYLFLDPPYRDCHTEYTKLGFNDDDQKRMCLLMNKASEAEASVSMANKYNSDDFFENILDKSFLIDLHDVQYTAGRGQRGRGKKKVTECFIHNWEHTTNSIEDFFIKG